jgi:hypothetical protein
MNFSDSWLMGQKQDTLSLFRVVRFNCIADAILALSGVPDRLRFLRALVSGSLDPLERKKSRAKDTLWELELLSFLKRSSFDATLEEPPDIVVNFGDAKIGIACKKLYADRHVQNVLSEAVAQIEPTFDFGIVAVNIDDLSPNQILRTPTRESASRCIDDLNARFIRSHERHFRKYLASGRLISALVSTSVLADLHHERVRFYNAHRSTYGRYRACPGRRIDS